LTPFRLGSIRARVNVIIEVRSAATSRSNTKMDKPRADVVDRFLYTKCDIPAITGSSPADSFGSDGRSCEFGRQYPRDRSGRGDERAAGRSGLMEDEAGGGQKIIACVVKADPAATTRCAPTAIADTRCRRSSTSSSHYKDSKGNWVKVCEGGRRGDAHRLLRGHRAGGGEVGLGRAALSLGRCKVPFFSNPESRDFQGR